MTPRIERDVPIPARKNGGRKNKYKPLLLKMRKGDSIFFGDLDTRDLWTAGQIALGAGNFTVRKVRGGARIWRI